MFPCLNTDIKNFSGYEKPSLHLGQFNPYLETELIFLIYFSPQVGHVNDVSLLEYGKYIQSFLSVSSL